jgi:excinuclease ABC subunit A
LDFKAKPRKPKGHLNVRSAKALELKSIDVDIPLGVFTALTGVSGSGKSTFVEKILHRLWQERQGEDSSSHPEGHIEGWNQIERLDYIDSTPLGLTSRSDVGTYTEILTKIRDLYDQLSEAKTKGLKAGHFSFNTRQGMCKSCQGMGYRKVDLKFLPPVRLACSHCQGFRLNHVSLEVRFKGFTFGQILQKNAFELVSLFEHVPAVLKRLQALIDVGLGYLPLGFEVAHLSIGESQRLKLVPRLHRVGPKTLLIIDEPCKGLHPQDIDKLHQTLDKWIDKGASILCIEHQIRFISKCDWVIEMGPGSGEKGGQVIAQATPYDLLETDCPTAEQLLRYYQKSEGELPSTKVLGLPASIAEV